MFLTIRTISSPSLFSSRLVPSRKSRCCSAFLPSLAKNTSYHKRRNLLPTAIFLLSFHFSLPPHTIAKASLLLRGNRPQFNSRSDLRLATIALVRHIVFLPLFTAEVALRHQRRDAIDHRRLYIYSRGEHDPQCTSFHAGLCN
jgi:hypothetical protein